MKQKKKLSEEDVIHIAYLAKLTLTPDEVKKFQTQLTEILNYVETLSSINTTETPEMGQPTGLTNTYRDDESKHVQLSHKEALQNAPEHEFDMFKVSAIFQE